jgi:hypothetical protein
VLLKIPISPILVSDFFCGVSAPQREQTLRVFISTLQIFIEHELALRESTLPGPPHPDKAASSRPE